MEKIEEVLFRYLNPELRLLVLSGQRGEIKKVTARPLLLKEGLVFQITKYVDTRVYHENLEAESALSQLSALFLRSFSQCQIQSARGSATILSSRKGSIRVKETPVKNPPEETPAGIAPDLSHNRKKQYLLPEGTPVPFLVDLGVMTREGRIVRAKYHKYRQINRFLEMVEDIVPVLRSLDREELTVLDFGCGKSYLTFALYDYLHERLRLPVRMIGLDLKRDVIEACNELAEKYGYTGLSFLHGDVADYQGTDAVDLMVTLHACDTATDYALMRAIQWKAAVILSVPCCQHEVNGQIRRDSFSPLLSYGIIKERFSALVTDAVRGKLLEQAGYQVQIMEFIDIEDTPKNLLIRAVRQKNRPMEGRRREREERELRQFLEEFQLDPTLCRLLRQGEHEI